MVPNPNHHTSRLRAGIVQACGNRPGMRVLLLLLCFVQAKCLFLVHGSALRGAPRNIASTAFTRCARTRPPIASEFEDEEDEQENFIDADDSWRQFRSDAIAEGWWQTLRREARRSVTAPSVRQRLEEVATETSACPICALAPFACPDCALAPFGRHPRPRQAGGVLVAATVFVALLKAYIVRAGGGIVIVPDEAGLGIYNFNELKALDPSKLFKLHLPSSMPPMPPPMLRIERELSLTLSRLLIGDAGDGHPPA